MTVGESIMEALSTALATVAGATLFRSRQAAVARSEGIAILLQPDEESNEDRTIDLQINKLTVLVNILARADIPDQAADPVLQSVNQVIMQDRTLGGLCSRIIAHSTKWIFEEADATAVSIEKRYTITYLTRSSDMTIPL